VQPILGKFILPWYGGGPAVWTVCLLFFQSLLLIGYIYSYLITKFSLKNQAKIHGLIVIISLAVLPIIPDSSWKSGHLEDPTFTILLLLLITVGLPYALVSSTSPLIQYWFGLQNQKTSPYRLYALSNIGSLLGLLSYPFIIEPNIGLKTQGIFWSAGYSLFVVLTVWCTCKLSKLTVADEVIAIENETLPPTIRNIILWLMLSATGNILLLSVTNHITQDVAPIPFLWILILSLYLLSFIISFDRPKWYNRKVFGSLLLILLILSSKILINGAFTHIIIQIVVFSITLFVGCMTCHGELYRIKPGTKYLTFFYMVMSFGGVLGGSFVSMIAPKIFNSYWEIYIGLILICILFGISILFDKSIGNIKYKFSGISICSIVLVSLLFFFIAHIDLYRKYSIDSSRNFYGVLRVVDKYQSTPNWQRILKHGRLTHGGQMMDKRKQQIPSTYFDYGSGVDKAFQYMHMLRGQKHGLRVGAVGLGVGTISAYARPDDMFRFYEINPKVVKLAETYFTYLANTPAQTEIILGDARIQMEQERMKGQSQQFDILVIDAFNSDAVPMHLITREAFALYDYHLKTDGILAVHISAIHIDLGPVVKGLSRTISRTPVRLEKKGNYAVGGSWSDWILLIRNNLFLRNKNLHESARMSADPEIIWTDDHSNLLQVFK